MRKTKYTLPCDLNVLEFNPFDQNRVISRTTTQTQQHIHQQNGRKEIKKRPSQSLDIKFIT